MSKNCHKKGCKKPRCPKCGRRHASKKTNHKIKPSVHPATQNRVYGWQRDLPDPRDHPYQIVSADRAPVKLPTSTDLRPQMPPVYDQGDLGSCTAQAVGACYHYAQIKQRKQTPFLPSCLFIYYNERVIDGTVNIDAGSYLRTGMKTLNQQGTCSEALWVYDISKFAVRPPVPAYTMGLANRTIQYNRISQVLYNLQYCLAVDKQPFVFGFLVYSSFISPSVARTGIVPLPRRGEVLLGGHAVTAVGYNNRGYFIVRNSWGTSWGDRGYFYMPFSYVLNPGLCSDFWCLKLI